MFNKLLLIATTLVVFLIVNVGGNIRGSVLSFFPTHGWSMLSDSAGHISFKISLPKTSATLIVLTHWTEILAF